MAPLARVEGLSFAYPGAAWAVREVSLTIEEGEVVALLGPSGSGKSTLLRALAGLVPHFHGGRFAGRVEVAGLDTRQVRPARLAGTVATVFQDPEDQIVMGRVANEVAFGLENLGVPGPEIRSRAIAALVRVGASHLEARSTATLSGGELQRVCLASALAMEPSLLLLDEPTSQLDPAGAEAFLDAVEDLGCAAVLSEHRIERALRLADRVVYLEEGRVLLDAPVDEARAWLAENRPRYAGNGADDSLWLRATRVGGRAPVVALEGVSFAYDGVDVLRDLSLDVEPGEILALRGPNGSGKTTFAKLAAGLLEPSAGSVTRAGRATYLSQDPGRYLVTERAVDEVALGAHGDARRARAALEEFGLGWAATRHPRDLSSGERERLGIAATAVGEPELLVLDEPTRGVDPDRKAAIGDWLLERAARGTAVVVATHDRTLPAHRVLDLEREVVCVS
jgi:energy-coupling factor transporter ATP-binding protein EcfA2